MTPTSRLVALCAVALAAALPARADWSGRLQIRTEPKGARGEGDSEGTAWGKGQKMRFDMTKEEVGAVATILDMKAHKATMLMEGRKTYMTMDLDKARGPNGMPTCDSNDVDACLKKAGFTKGGSETVNGKKADKWEKDREDPRRGKSHETLWVPQGVKDFAMVKQVTKFADRTVTMDVLDFKQESVPDAKFEVPAGYTEMSAHMPGMGGMGGPGMGGRPGMPPGMPPPGAPGQ